MTGLWLAVASTQCCSADKRRNAYIQHAQVCLQHLTPVHHMITTDYLAASARQIQTVSSVLVLHE